ncbi:MAG: hypothetical protein FVQ84_12305 [Planctomycetes bacterium]|nr:hypothetical protein [Planctomycetota bacterium]
MEWIRSTSTLFQSIRSGNLLNEGQRIAESTLTAIGARTAAFTGQDISWDRLLNSSQDLVPKELGPGRGVFYPTATGCDEFV